MLLLYWTISSPSRSVVANVYGIFGSSRPSKEYDVYNVIKRKVLIRLSAHEKIWQQPIVDGNEFFVDYINERVLFEIASWIFQIIFVYFVIDIIL